MSGPVNMPAAEVDIDARLVRRLLEAQCPDLLAAAVDGTEGDGVLVDAGFGWDNVLYRLGPDLCVRLPRRLMGAELIENEQRWLPVVAPSLPLPVPAPVFAGRPAPELGYPWRWSVCPWFDGMPWESSPPEDGPAAARTLAAFVNDLHHPAPPDAPRNPLRGVPLEYRRETFERGLAALPRELDDERARALAVFEAGVAAPAFTGPPVWLHGDLHPANILVSGGQVSAVIDFGDITAGDPASDLACAWMLFDAGDRAAFQSACAGVDDATWTRAHGWAAQFGVVFVANSADNPTIAAIGRRTLAAACA